MIEEPKKIEDFIDQIHLGKWENVMPKIPSNSVDMIITSPPYNVKLGQNKFRDKSKGYAECEDDLPYDKYLEWMNDFFYACNRVLKMGGRIGLNIGDGANGQIPTHADFTQLLKNVGIWKYKQQDPDIVPFQMMTTIVWNKQQIGASTSWGSWKSPSMPSFPTQFEYILVLGKGSTRHEGDPNKITVSGEDFIRNSRALWEFPPETQMMKQYGHPAAFPPELPRRLIDQLTYAEDIVLDPFSGVGTTCAVAKQMGRHYIGIEMTKKYYETSLERLNGVPITQRIKVGKEEISVPEWMG